VSDIQWIFKKHGATIKIIIVDVKFVFEGEFQRSCYVTVSFDLFLQTTQTASYFSHVIGKYCVCQLPATTTNSGRHDKPQIHSGSTPFLQPRFGTARFLVVPKIEGDVKRSTFFTGCRSWDSCAQMGQQPTRSFLHGRNEHMDRTIKKMCGRKWWLCWNISVQCVREINLIFVWPCIISNDGKEESQLDAKITVYCRRRKNQRMTQVKMFFHFRLIQHVSGIIGLLINWIYQ